MNDNDRGTGVETTRWIQWNPPVFTLSAVLTLIFVLFAAFATEIAEPLFAAIQG
jgi:choline/glycine/proline betaine transport protein